MLKAQMLRIIGEHYAPSDCYSTGPLHGDFRDHSCPSCEGLEMLSTTPNQALEQFAAKVREQCARACEAEYPYTIFHTDQRAATNCATAIRAIKELPE